MVCSDTPIVDKGHLALQVRRELFEQLFWYCPSALSCESAARIYHEGHEAWLPFMTTNDSRCYLTMLDLMLAGF